MRRGIPAATLIPPEEREIVRCARENRRVRPSDPQSLGERELEGGFR